MTFAGASHTEHLEMKGLMESSLTGIIGIGWLVESQYDLSFRLA
jgi:hypothetical protein